MTYYPPQQPGPWDPQQPQYPQQPIPYPAYDVPPPPYGYGVPQQPGYPYGYPVPPPTKGGRTWWVLGGVASVVVVAAVAIGAVVLLRSGGVSGESRDEAEIKRLVQDFSAAGSSGKFSELGQFFCQAEAGMFGALGELGTILEGIDIPETAPAVEVTATDIRIKGDVASARMNSGGPFDTAYFRKESGEWKVCMSAASEFSK